MMMNDEGPIRTVTPHLFTFDLGIYNNHQTIKQINCVGAKKIGLQNPTSAIPETFELSPCGGENAYMP